MMGLRQFTLIAALSLTILVIEFAPGCHGRTLIAKGNKNILRKIAFDTDGSLRNRVNDGSRSDLEKSWKKDVAGEFNEEAKVSENDDVEKKELWSLLRRLANLVDKKQKKNLVKNDQVLGKSKSTSCVDGKDGKNCVHDVDDKDDGNSGDGGSGSGENGYGSGDGGYGSGDGSGSGENGYGSGDGGYGSGDRSGSGENGYGSGDGGYGSGGQSGDGGENGSGSGGSGNGGESGADSSEESGSDSSEESGSGDFQAREIASENLEQTVAKIFERSRSTGAQMIKNYGGQITWEDKIQLLKEFLDILKRKTEK